MYVHNVCVHIYKISLSYTHMCVSVHGRRRGRYKPFQLVGKSLAASRLSKRLTVQKQYIKPGQEHNEITVKEAGAGLCWGLLVSIKQFGIYSQ